MHRDVVMMVHLQEEQQIAHQARTPPLRERVQRVQRLLVAHELPRERHD